MSSEQAVCQSKIRYKDPVSAHAAKTRLIKRCRRRGDITLHVYCCPECHGYHLGNKIAKKAKHHAQ